jgi:hypothetical protein
MLLVATLFLEIRSVNFSILSSSGVHFIRARVLLLIYFKRRAVAGIFHGVVLVLLLESGDGYSA